MANPNLQCTLQFASSILPSLLLYLHCVNVCMDLEPHVWIGYQHMLEVLAIVELPATSSFDPRARTSDPQKSQRLLELLTARSPGAS